MSLLLDSNIVVPLTRGELNRLDSKIVALLEDYQGSISVSAASLWEIAIKTRIGKLDPLVDLHDLPDYVTEMGFFLLGVSPRHAVEELKPLPATKDPFDRLLLAQCQIENMRLVTVDRALADHPLVWRG